jgi:hypothetical protein
MQSNNIDRLGYYMVGWKKFYHKTLALIESKKTGYQIEWIFNDSAYGSIDWSIPILVDLNELYRIRAQQLRDKYDYVVLYFSGGADSTNILSVFLNNNIFIDEIVMQFPEPVKSTVNTEDKTSANGFSEIPFSAVPIINKLKNLIHPATKIRYQDTSKGLISLLNQEDWFEKYPMGAHLSLNPLARQHILFTEKDILNLCDTGKSVAQILGTDKPLLLHDGKDYYSYFLDVSALHVPPVDLTTREIYDNSYHTELFYWTPDLPEITIKQVQEIKKYCEMNPAIKQLVCNPHIHIGDLRDILHPIIYPEMPELPFQVDKVSQHGGGRRKKDQWFWDTASEFQKFNYQQAINYLENNISKNAFINDSIRNGFVGHKSRLYKI